MQILFLVASLFLFPFSQQQDLPPQVKSYITAHFPQHNVIKYKSVVKPYKAKYKVYLNDDIKIEFNEKFDPVEIDGDAGLPDSVIPEKIVNYVRKNYQGMKIVEWERKTSKQEIELQNGVELEFDLQGNFLRID